ncbi:MAG TPA: amidase [Solirubrobacterales bacterium]|nr:amidase [Solirubrobacterales bacterium]
MADHDIAFAGAARQAEMVRAGEVSPTELVKLHLERIERIDPRLNSFRVVLAERALLEAEQAEARLKGGDERPLLGVPIALKDSTDLAGELTTLGTDGFTEPAAADSEMVRRLREAGAIVVGKTLLPELAICGFTESATFGVTRNPWNEQRTPAGSSGGSAAAVAAGLVPIASASDGAGSIRIPAASCGLFGLKPQRGRISLAPHREHWNGLSVDGCISRTVIDTALWLDVTSGGSEEPGAPAPPQRPFVEAVKTPPGKLRIAYSTLPPRAAAPPTVSDVVKNAVGETADLLRSLGHETAQRDPEWGTIGNNSVPRYLRGAAEDVANVPHPERLERRTRGFGRLGRLIPDKVFEQARRAVEADAARVNAIFDAHDVLMTPVMGGTALPVRRWEGRSALYTVLGMSRFYPYCIPWNHLGNPSMAVPAGFAADGMPLSVQIVGRPGDEATLLSLAAQLEAERPWADARPPIS